MRIVATSSRWLSTCIATGDHELAGSMKNPHQSGDDGEQMPGSFESPARHSPLYTYSPDFRYYFHERVEINLNTDSAPEFDESFAANPDGCTFTVSAFGGDLVSYPDGDE